MASTVWRGQLTFGLVSVPVRLVRAARKERVRMHYLRQAAPEPPPEESEPGEPEPEPAAYPSPPAPPSRLAAFPAPAAREPEPPPAQPPVTRLKQTLVAPDSEDEPALRGEVLKGYQYAPDQYVVFREDELRKLRLKTSTEMQILRSVKLAEIDPLYFETSYYVIPDRGGERPYALLFQALRKTGHVALATVAMHGREHVVLVRPGALGLVAHTMFYQDEIRAENEFDAAAIAVNDKELGLANSFIDAISAPFDPAEFKDKYREEVEALIAGKMDRREVASAGAAPPPAAAPVVDIMEALKKSLAMARKPPAPETEVPARKKPAKMTEIPPRARRRKA